MFMAEADANIRRFIDAKQHGGQAQKAADYSIGLLRVSQLRLHRHHTNPIAVRVDDAFKAFDH